MKPARNPQQQYSNAGTAAGPAIRDRARTRHRFPDRPPDRSGAIRGQRRAGALAPCRSQNIAAADDGGITAKANEARLLSTGLICLNCAWGNERNHKSNLMNRIAIWTGALVLMSAASAVAAPAYVPSNLNLRSGPGTNNEIIGKIPAGSLVDATNC